MRVELTGVSKGRDGLALPVTTVAFATGRATLVVAETEQRPTVLGLIASGRMAPDTGLVSIDEGADASARSRSLSTSASARSRSLSTSASALRRRVAPVDALGVSDPAPNVPLAGVVGEELMFAGLPASPLAARRWLRAAGLSDRARVPFADIEPEVRVRVLLELAALRPGVEGLVLVSPDRHGGDPRRWWAIAEEFAGRGFAVLVVAGAAAALVLSERQRDEALVLSERQRDEASVPFAEPAEAAHRRLRPSAVRPRAVARRTRPARPDGVGRS